MQIKIENEKLEQAIDLLFNLELKGKQSRHRTKFIKTLTERLTEVQEQQDELIKEHCHLDESGEPRKIENDTKWDIKDLKAYVKDVNELYAEELVIDGGDAHGMLKTVKVVLDNCEVGYSGQEAMTYDYLCEAFEQEEEEGDAE